MQEGCQQISPKQVGQAQLPQVTLAERVVSGKNGENIGDSRELPVLRC
jgi:hypothetical protein